MTFATNLKPSRNLVRKYKTRWNIETGFRIMEEGKIKTKSNNPLIRLFYFLLRCLLHLTWTLHNAKKPWLIFKNYLRFIEKKLDQYRTTKPPPDLLW
jgi:IS4 transposase